MRSASMIVLSSSWREHKKEWKWLNDELEKVGVPPITEATPISRAGDVSFQSRSDEILEWLSHHLDVQSFVALDDTDLRDPHGEAFGRHFVHIDNRTGLVDDDITKALQVLQLRIDRSTLPAPLRMDPCG